MDDLGARSFGSNTDPSPQRNRETAAPVLCAILPKSKSTDVPQCSISVLHRSSDVNTYLGKTKTPGCHPPTFMLHILSFLTPQSNVTDNTVIKAPSSKQSMQAAAQQYVYLLSNLATAKETGVHEQWEKDVGPSNKASRYTSGAARANSGIF